MNVPSMKEKVEVLTVLASCLIVIRKATKEEGLTKAQRVEIVNNVESDLLFGCCALLKDVGGADSMLDASHKIALKSSRITKDYIKRARNGDMKSMVASAIGAEKKTIKGEQIEVEIKDPITAAKIQAAIEQEFGSDVVEFEDGRITAIDVDADKADEAKEKIEAIVNRYNK